jgi:exodeoxyribonuclease V beta subunit
VRTGPQGSDLKTALAQLGIPAVTIDDSKVLHSDEARYLLYLLQAVAAPDRSSINRALLSPFTGLGVAAILGLDDEVVLGLFTKYKNRWQQDGIYTALMDFIADFGVRTVLLQSPAGNGERIITNLFQLTELVHQLESRRNLSMAELISWLKRGIDGMLTEGDEYAQRVESDEEAVKIVTIHKSKGLEYKIVLAPFLDFKAGADFRFLSFRDPGTGEYVAGEKDRLTKEQEAWQLQQAEQENRRLLYVAITRAVYKCYIFRNESGYNRNSSLSVFLNALKADGPASAVIREEKGLPAAPVDGYKKAVVLKTPVQLEPVNFALREENWRKLSYTMLAAKTDQGLRGRSFPQADPYDSFVFHTLRRGAKTGNFLHFIFENINFSDDSRWDKWLKEGIRRFVPGQQELYHPMLRQMLQHVLHAAIPIDKVQFPLASVDWNKRIAEFEFDFPVPVFYPDALNALSDAERSINTRNFLEYSNGELEGILNGKMDLFFELDGRYYILDWKSNWLGAITQDYAPQALAEAMNQSNYHLQYLLYTLAARKYLESRIAGFDYERQFGGVIYLFVRGIRAGSQNGIFTTKPSLQKLRDLERILS